MKDDAQEKVYVKFGKSKLFLDTLQFNFWKTIERGRDDMKNVKLMIYESSAFLNLLF